MGISELNFILIFMYSIVDSFIFVVAEIEILCQQCRYYCDDGSVLWEEWMYCYDLGVQLGPVIQRCDTTQNRSNSIRFDSKCEYDFDWSRC